VRVEKDVMGQDTDALAGWLTARLAARKGATSDLPESSEPARRRPLDGAACEICRRTILAGETTSRFCREDRELEACPLCEGKLLSQGFVRAA
jgi:hypothetical protein